MPVAPSSRRRGADRLHVEVERCGLVDVVGDPRVIGPHIVAHVHAVAPGLVGVPDALHVEVEQRRQLDRLAAGGEVEADLGGGRVAGAGLES